MKLIAVQIGLTAVAGSLHALGWLYPGMWYAVWGAQIAAILLAAVSRPLPALLWGTLVGAIGISSSFYWGVAALQQTFGASDSLAWIIFTALVAMEASAFGLFTFLVSHSVQRGVRWLWLAPVAWAAVEHWCPRVFPWRMGYSQLEVSPLLQIADLVGPAGIGFVMTAVCSLPAAWWLACRPPRKIEPLQRPGRSQRRAEVLCVVWFSFAALLLLGATLAYGVIRVAQCDAWAAQQPKLKVALVQVDPAYVDFDKKLRARSLAVHEQVDLICWPESSLGIYSEDLTDFKDRARTFELSRDSPESLEPSKDLSTHLLAGGRLYREGASDVGPYSMAAFLIAPDDTILGKYRKRTLLPFGEYVPGQSIYPDIRKWATLTDLMEAGKDPAPLVTASGHRLGLVICYEDTLLRNARLTVADGAQALFSLIQATVFENPLTLVQHQRLAVLRAVENRRYFVRCASTGMTCVIDPAGRVVGNLPLQTEGTLVSEIALLEGRTVYNRIGDVFPLGCSALLLGGWWLSRRDEKLPKRSTQLTQTA